MKIAILGAGLTGLTAAYYLSQKGHQVTLFEKEAAPGGLASGFKETRWEWPLEKFYHHFFASDREAINLIKELGLGAKLFYKTPLTSIYYNNLTMKQFNNEAIYPFDSPLALLTFPHLSFTEKIRTGAALAYLKFTPYRQHFDRLIAKDWLERYLGKKAFDILWKPLLQSKFGSYWEQVPMAWFWARIKKRTRSLGYLEGGFQTLIDRLTEKIKENGGQILLNQEVQKIEKNNLQFDRVVSTIPTPIFLKIAPEIPENFHRSLSQIDHLWAQTLILEMDKPFLNNTYWLNINDTSFPFLAVVEHTNFIDKTHYGNHHILYIGNYLPSGHPYLKKSTPELLKIFMPYLQKINPDFRYQLSAISYQLFTAPFAQPLFPPNYSQFIYKLQNTNYQILPNLFLANQDMVYPWDRGTNYAIALGRKVAKAVENPEV